MEKRPFRRANLLEHGYKFVYEPPSTDLATAKGGVGIIFNENIDNVIGIVYKDILLETMADDFFEKTMSEISKPVDTVFENESVESVLKKFISKRSHMFIVKDEFGGTTGLVTLEDCIETLLGVEIMDESDKVADMRKLAKDQLRQERKAKDKN